MARTSLGDDAYPTPPPRILVRLVELPFAAVAWTVERLLGVGPMARPRARSLSRAAPSSRSPAAGPRGAAARRR